MLSKPIILIHCQYVYGIGHFVRTIELAKALCLHFQVYLLNGGEQVPNFDIPEDIRVIQLPAIYKDEGDQILSPVNPKQSLDSCLQDRQLLIAECLKAITPDILITEHFPFGLLFKNEVLQLILKAKQLKPTVKVVCSVRDIIESRNGNDNDEDTCDLINKWYDKILVHGDADFISLSDSFPLSKNIKIAVTQTGYITRSIPKPTPTGSIPTILVSIAAGRLGSELIDAVVASYPFILSREKVKLIVFSGAFQIDYEKQCEKAKGMSTDGILFKNFDSKTYLQDLASASLVISLGGYNSVLEAISSNKRTLIYNRAFLGSNKEQDIRINLFQKSGLLDLISPADLQPETLSTLILQNLNKSSSCRNNLNIQGAKNSCQELLDLM
jgi:predicted glycosyltransferase